MDDETEEERKLRILKTRRYNNLDIEFSKLHEETLSKMNEQNRRSYLELCEDIFGDE